MTVRIRCRALPARAHRWLRMGAMQLLLLAAAVTVGLLAWSRTRRNPADPSRSTRHASAGAATRSPTRTNVEAEANFDTIKGSTSECV